MDAKPKHDFEKVVKSWQTADFWTQQVLEHSISKLVCKKCGYVAGPYSDPGKQKKCIA